MPRRIALCRGKPIALPDVAAPRRDHALPGKPPALVLNENAVNIMASRKQKRAARSNIKKAARAAKRKRTIAHLPKKTRRALGKQAANVRKRKRH